MKELVIVTTFNREELLYLCLEAIRANDEEIPIWVFSDRGAGSPELAYTVNHFRAQCVIRDNHDHYGNSFNLLEACSWAIGQAEEIIHLVEDDTILHKGYLEWARENLKTREFAAVCGRIGSPHITNWYESPCASWNAENLSIALSHVIPEYFCQDRKEMQTILDTKIFPASRYKKGGAEQDGFFLRCIEHYQWKTRFPLDPLASHLGWWGYNQPPGRARPVGSFDVRIEECRRMFRDRETRKNFFGHRITDAEMKGAGL